MSAVSSTAITSGIGKSAYNIHGRGAQGPGLTQVGRRLSP